MAGIRTSLTNEVTIPPNGGTDHNAHAISEATFPRSDSLNSFKHQESLRFRFFGELRAIRLV